MTDDPLLPHLLEIVAQPEASGTLLAGGLGLRLKQAVLRADGATTLIPGAPDARATQDIDLILRLDLWVHPEKATAFRVMLARLGYRMVLESWHLRKPLDDGSGRELKLDLQSRSPRPEEVVKVKDRPRQVGKGMGTGLAGLETPEAFAADDAPQSFRVAQGEAATVLLPHPYAWLNMKVAAAHDWLRESRGDPTVTPKADRETGISRRLKHVYDVYLLTAMLTETELDEAATFARNYEAHPVATDLRMKAVELYGSPDAVGTDALRNYLRRETGGDGSFDHDLFWDQGLKVALGI